MEPENFDGFFLDALSVTDKMTASLTFDAVEFRVKPLNQHFLKTLF